MNDKIVIREPLFVAPNECKSGAAQHEQDNFFRRERKEGANLNSHIGTNGPYKKCQKWEQDGGNGQRNDPPLKLNEREDMSCFVEYKGDTHNLSNEKNVLTSYRKGEINNKYNIMDNIHDVHYTRESSKNLNDYLRHVKINHTAPCVGEFRTCMNCFLNISTLFCKTCNIFLCAVCSIKLHKNDQDHIINVASSGLFQNDYSYNDVIVREKDKWLVEMDNNVPVKIREKCPVHTNEYVKYACKTCQYTFLCSDCLLNDPIHVQNEADGGNTSREKRQDGAHAEDESKCSRDEAGKNNDSGSAPPLFGMSSSGGKKSGRETADLALRGGHSPTQKIVSIRKEAEPTPPMTTSAANHHNDLVQLKPGFKLIRGSHEIYTLIDAKNEIKQELNDKLQLLCKKSLVLKNTIPSLRNIYKYGKITSKNVKRSIRASFTITNIFLERKKKKLHEELKVVQDKSTKFLKNMDEQRINYHSYLGMKKNELQHMIKLSGRNAGLSLDYYVQKLESYKCLFFSKENLIDIEKKLEIPHSKMKSEDLPSLVEPMKIEVSETKKNVSDTSALIKKEFEKLLSCSSEISVYPAHLKDILQKRIYDRQRDEPVDADAKKRQRYFHVLPFTDLYMNIGVTYQQQFWRKDSLHQKWEVRTVSLRSIYLCVHTHGQAVGNGNRNSDRNSMINFVDSPADGSHDSAFPAQSPLREDPPKSGSAENNHFISKNEINNFSNDIESIVSITNVRVKLFSDPDITNITVLEKRNHPYGIEITEYNEKRDLCGYWLLRGNNESDVNTLYNTLVSLKRENKTSALVPSFHPKINMSNPMFHFHQKNVNTVYKHLAANLVEQTRVVPVRENHDMEETKENPLTGNGLRKQQDSLETVQSSDTGNYNYDPFMRGSSLLYYYDGMDDTEYSDHVKKYQIEDFVPGPTNLSDSNNEMALAECSQNVCAESSGTESMNPFSLPRSALVEAPLGGGPQMSRSNGDNLTAEEQTKPPQTNVSRGKVSPQGGVSASRLHTLGVHPKRRDINVPDIDITTVKPNLVHEEQHFMALNVGSNFSHGDYTAGMYSNGVNTAVGVHTGCYSNGDAQGGNAQGGNAQRGSSLTDGSPLIGVIPVSTPPSEERTNVGDQTNQHSVERRNGDRSAHVSDVTTEWNYGDELGLKNGLKLSSLPVEDPPKMEEGIHPTGGTGKGEPHTDEVDGVAMQVLHSTATSVENRKTCTGLAAIEGGLCMRLSDRTVGGLTGEDTKVTDLEEQFAKTGESLNSDEVTKFLRRLDWAHNTSDGLHQVGSEAATTPRNHCQVKRLTDERQFHTVETEAEAALLCPNEGDKHIHEADRTEANNTPGCMKQPDHRTRNGDPKGEPKGERLSKVYSDEGPFSDGTPMNGTSLSPRESRNKERQLVSDMRRENLVGGNPPCVGHTRESITTYGKQEGDPLIIVEDHSSVRASTKVMVPLRKMENSEKECFPVREITAKVPFGCESVSIEEPQKEMKIHNVLSDQRGGSDRRDLNQPEWTTTGVALTRGHGNGEVRPDRVHTCEEIHKGTNLQAHRKNCVMRSSMKDPPREEQNRTEVSPARIHNKKDNPMENQMGNHETTSNLSVILKLTSVHVDRRARMVQGTKNAQGGMRSGVGRTKLQKEERNKTPPPKRKKNQGSVGTSAVSTSKPKARLKTLHEELEPAGGVPASVISRVMSQIGSKRLGS
ncbi:hypothetical protein C922_03934 [Plasmodium inui San Antonio 1]|uniref:B box-type domain-containing protein n=1 Tax=Plasmodium inui San Antonio 1 TaxID=1237626 RepID=W7AK25_9APIC|nr:hypothetical protein C922_03934 [Plasmodium inui San Antonio 1]EUD65686.1 hypothetical protein C922_03934 [Plasmodium inui San Antonio 1]